ncbi:MAG TPA: MFS transporter [Vicinamibacterales bacterium]|jgi:MFS family permease|nr:MFS transporter [Vicinamibacterales bacterium]
MSVALYGSYYAFDYIGPLAPLLSRQLHFSDSQIGLLQAVYSLPNIVAMLVCGVVIDRIGTRKSMAIFSVLVFVGLAITAISPRLGIMVVGRLIVGSGAEALALASNVGVMRWFWHDELSMAFGVRSTFLRLGSLTAQVSPTWASNAYTHWQWPLLLGVAFGGFCLIGAALYWVVDTRGEQRFTMGHATNEERIAFGDVFRFNQSFWLIAALCITFYGCIFPFETFGQKFLIEARHVSPRDASLLVGMEPFFAMIGAPVFGWMVDRYARRSLFMMFGSLLIVPVYLMLGYTNIPAVIPMAMMGVAFALVPSVMWPALAYVVEKSRLGIGNGMLDTIQQIGLVAINLMIGWANDRWLASANNPAGYHASMWMFTGIAALAVIFALALWRVETGPDAHGLETMTAGS